MSDVKISFDIPAAVAHLREESNRALTITGNQALKDITQHVPVQGGDSKDGGGGTLQNSGITFSDRKAEDGQFTLRWDEPYAQYLFHGEVMYGDPTNRTYGPKKLTFTATMARMEWTKYAAELYGEDWKMIYQVALRSGL